MNPGIWQSFRDAYWFWALVPIAALLLWRLTRKGPQSAVFYFSSDRASLDSWVAKGRRSLYLLRFLALGFLVAALARPQTSGVNTRTTTTEGIDIVLSIDVSSSMLAKDLKPNRLEALKEVASKFVLDRLNDRLGLVVYAGESYTKTPLTTDTEITLSALKELDYGAIEDGTAIGMGLATAVNRLKESDGLSKVIILLTDGVNNSGFIEPQTAANLALEYGIKIYTIGIGTNGNALTPIAYNADGSFRYGMRTVEIDEQLLEEIASLTGGAYYRATDNQSLEEIYDEINQLEKTEVEEFSFYTYDEHYRFWVIAALALLLLEALLKYTLFKEALS
jgi:Ca-activated chloride channel family protein